MKDKPVFEIGRISVEDDGSHSLNLNGGEFSVPEVPSSESRNTGDCALVVNVDADTRIALGLAGYVHFI